MAMMMSAVSFIPLLESFPPLRTRKGRYMTWAVILLFFGSFTSIFYTNRTTHHFSVYHVPPNMCFLAIEDKGFRRLL